ncbi:MAG: terminase small subunit [bacterium]
MNGKALTPKQRRFVEEYLVDLNSTQAAIRAGYSKKTARFIGSENLTKPNISEAIQEAMETRSERCEISADKVLNELAVVGFASKEDIEAWNSNGVIMRVSDKISALEKLGKHLRLFTDVLQLTPQEELQNLSDEELEARAQRLFPEAFAAFNRTRQ